MYIHEKILNIWLWLFTTWHSAEPCTSFISAIKSCWIHTFPQGIGTEHDVTCFLLDAILQVAVCIPWSSSENPHFSINFLNLKSVEGLPCLPVVPDTAPYGGVCYYKPLCIWPTVLILLLSEDKDKE